MKEYKLKGTALLVKGRMGICHDDASDIIRRALRKKLRTRVRRLVWRAYHDGESTVRWNFVKNIGKNDHWVQMHVRSIPNRYGEYRIYLSGPCAQHVVSRLNEPRGAERNDLALGYDLKELKKRDRLLLRERKEKRKKKHRELASKQGQRRRAKKARPVFRDPIKPAQVQVRTPGPKPSHKLAILMPQFHKSTLAWDDCIDMATAVFQVPRDNKNTARQMVARRLYRSLEKSGWRYAQYKHGGFTLHFAAQGAWLVDLSTATVKTRMVVSCTKNNRNLIYRRLRKRLRKQRCMGLHHHVRLVA